MVLATPKVFVRGDGILFLRQEWGGGRTMTYRNVLPWFVCVCYCLLQVLLLQEDGQLFFFFGNRFYFFGTMHFDVFSRSFYCR